MDSRMARDMQGSVVDSMYHRLLVPMVQIRILAAEQ
jgi:hypothetical protein